MFAGALPNERGKEEKKIDKRCTPEPDDSQWGPNESSQNRCTYPSVKQSISALTSLQSVRLCVAQEEGGISCRNKYISYPVQFCKTAPQGLQVSYIKIKMHKRFINFVFVQL